MSTIATAISLTVLAHLVGDYLIQSHWMATEKTKRWWPAIAHAVTYGVPFIPIVYALDVDRPWLALAVIVGTHAVIDRHRLARHVVWFKNQFAPAAFRPEHTATGYPDDTPPWLSFWLLILADNILHMLINVSAVVWL